MKANEFSTKYAIVRVYKDDDFSEKGWAYEVRRKSDNEFLQAGHTYDHDRDDSIEYASGIASYEAQKVANAYKAEEIEAIRDLLVQAGLEDITFVHHRNKPTFVMDGVRYEVFDILRYEGESRDAIGVNAKPEGQWKLVRINLDTFCRKATLVHIKKVVKNYLYKQGLL